MILLINACLTESARSIHDDSESVPNRAVEAARLFVDDGSTDDSVEGSRAPIPGTTDFAGQIRLELSRGIADAERQGALLGLAVACDHAAYRGQSRIPTGYLIKIPPELLRTRHQSRRQLRH